MRRITLEMPRSAFEERFAGEFNFQRDFDQEKFENFLKKSKTENRLVSEEFLWKRIGRLQNGEFMLNNAGILFFANEPNKFIRQNTLTCVRFHGNTKISIIDRKDLQGDLLSMVDEAEAFVKKHTRLASIYDGFKRIDIEEYPYLAIREAIINAVAHRDYDMDTTQIYVNVYDDSVEVISPGSIPKGLSLKEVQGKSNPRNYLIVDLLHKVGYIEKLGTGLKKMREAMLKHGLKEPAYDINRAFFQITFLGPGKDILNLVKPSNEVDLRELGLNERQIKMLNWLQKNKQISSLEYQKVLGTIEKTAQRDLNELIEKGFISKKGAGRSTIYSLK